MKYGDFSSIVQLGVGLHLGTALLQMYGEPWLKSLEHKISRTRNLVPFQATEDLRDLDETLLQLESQVEIFGIKLQNEYKLYVRINTVISILLVLILLFASFAAELRIGAECAFLISLISVCPAPILLTIVWGHARMQLQPLLKKADDLEQKALDAISDS